MSRGGSRSLGSLTIPTINWAVQLTARSRAPDLGTQSLRTLRARASIVLVDFGPFTAHGTADAGDVHLDIDA
jgi:hypothetical protein